MIYLRLLVTLFLSFYSEPEWGFYGHKLINEKAIYTLPPEMFGFYKTHMDFIVEHAVDPDKRRYALKGEYARHFIDIDHWGEWPFENVPRKLDEALLLYGQFHCISDSDTLVVLLDDALVQEIYNDCIYESRYSEKIDLSRCSDCITYCREDRLNPTEFKFEFENKLVQYGVLPYFFKDFYNRMVYAFRQMDTEKILRVSAEIGHYLSDAHVPLHTTENYNGQLTGQLGLHAFWETRLPELFAASHYDFLLGRCRYIEDVSTMIWDIVLESHALLPDVLKLEEELRSKIPEQHRFCFEERNNQSVRLECREYARRYHDSLDGMVEKRMQDAILAVGSVWYSAWIDSGQPDLNLLLKKNASQTLSQDSLLEKKFESGALYGRHHKNE